MSSTSAGRRELAEKDLYEEEGIWRFDLAAALRSCDRILTVLQVSVRACREEIDGEICLLPGCGIDVLEVANSN